MSDIILNENEIEEILDALNLKSLRKAEEFFEDNKCKNPHCDKCPKPDEHCISCKDNCKKKDFECCNRKGVIEIKLTNSMCTDIPLAGAEFIIKDCKGEVVDKLCTDYCGKAVSKPLCFGKYSIIEIKAPRGYECAKPVKVNLDQKILRVCLQNKKEFDEPKGQFKIKKIDACCEKVLLGGAEFEVFDCHEKKVDFIKTENGRFAFSKRLPFGKYTICETKAPYGYEKCIDEFTVIIDSENEIKTIVVENKQKPTNKTGLIGVDLFDKKCPCYKIEGIKFKVEAKCGTVVETICTDQNGRAVTKPLEFGEYKLINCGVPDCYKKLDEPVCVKLQCSEYIENQSIGLCRNSYDKCDKC